MKHYWALCWATYGFVLLSLLSVAYAQCSRPISDVDEEARPRHGTVEVTTDVGFAYQPTARLLEGENNGHVAFPY